MLEEGTAHRRDSGYMVYDGVVKVWPSVVQCLYEAQDAGSCASVFGQSAVQYYGRQCSAPFDAYAVGYCISVGKNHWNVDLKWNQLGPEVVEMLLCGLKSVQYGGGSVDVLRLSGNPIKNEGIRFLQQFPHQILQHMRTLKLSDCSLSQEAFDLLAETVPLLASLETLFIPSNPGGNGSTVNLLLALGKHQGVQHLKMDDTVIGRDDVVALFEVVQASGSLRELHIGSYHDISLECVQQLVKMVLSPSSLERLRVWVPSSVSPLDYIDSETISNNLTSLGFESMGASPEKLPIELGCTKLSNILKKNVTLEELWLRIPLGNTGVKAIVKSLKHNHTLKKLELSKAYHSRHFSESEQEFDNRIKWWH